MTVVTGEVYVTNEAGERRPLGVAGQLGLEWGDLAPVPTHWSSEVIFDLTDVDPRVLALLYGLPLPEVRCDWSDLITTQCAHCLGHDSSWLDTDTVKFYD